MSRIKRWLKAALCKHSSKKMVKTDLVLAHHVCEECGKDFVEPYNGFKALSQYER
jgi:ribosomal protein L32